MPGTVLTGCLTIHVTLSENKINTTLQLQSAITPLALRINRQQYLNLIKMICHNFSFDDGSDRLFVHDFDILKLFEPSNTYSFYCFLLSVRRGRPPLLPPHRPGIQLTLRLCHTRVRASTEYEALAQAAPPFQKILRQLSRNIKTAPPPPTHLPQTKLSSTWMCRILRWPSSAGTRKCLSRL